MKIAASLVLLILVVGCGSKEVEGQRGFVRQATVFGVDDRLPMDSTFFSQTPRMRAIGRLNGCTASKVSGTHVLTSAHCFSVPSGASLPPEITSPEQVTFYPAAPASGAPGANDGARIQAKRIVWSGDAALPGSDFAIVEVDPATFVSGNSGLTWSSITPLELSGLISSPPSSGLMVSAAGYSADLTPSGGFHSSCLLTKRAGWAGVYYSDCDWKGGASGGPIIQFNPGVGPGTTIIGLITGGHNEVPDWNATACGSDSACGAPPNVCWGYRCGRTCQTDSNCDTARPLCVRGLCRSSCSSTSCPTGSLCRYQPASGASACLATYRDADGNTVVDTLAAYWAPWDAVSAVALLNSDGRVHVYATDRARLNQVSLRPQANTTATPYNARFDRWADARGGVAVPNPTRLSGALHDGRQFVFAVGEDANVYANWQTVAAGLLGGWQNFFGSQTANTGDVATDSTSPTSSGGILYQYVQKSTGELLLKRKSGAWNANWLDWQTLATASGLNRISAANTQGFPVLVGINVSTSSPQIKITWGDSAGLSFVSLQQFGDGLPAGMCFSDVKIGQTNDGKLDVFLLANPSCGGNQTREVWRRTKLSSAAGSAWGSWQQYRAGDAQLNGATALALFPPDPSRGDGLVVISRGAVYHSTWGPSATNYMGWVPFYGPANPW